MLNVELFFNFCTAVGKSKREKDKLIQKSATGVISPFPAKKRGREKRKGKEKGNNLTFALSSLPFLLRASSLLWSGSWMCWWYFPSQFEKAEMTSVGFTMTCLQAHMRRLFFLAACKMCCYRKILAAVYIKLLFFFARYKIRMWQGCPEQHVDDKLFQTCYCCWTQLFWQDSTLS